MSNSHRYAIVALLSLVIFGGLKSVGALASRLKHRPQAEAVVWPVTRKVGQVVSQTYRQARRVVILILGSTVLLFGVAMIVLPGPAILIIPMGLAILAIEFAWAQRWLNNIRGRVNGLQQRIKLLQ